ncbi:unnamed protein product [Orchesella dallaii]|uniref:G-protein coupled receptors family 1 profile domain-containing protein n=1 Tax=Orchesella dallaii TaxID=48710 RepID=A0ABP1QG99_9HEXA
MRNKTSKEFLGLFSCLIIDFPTDGESRGQDCSYRFPDVCVECYQMGEFLSGEAITDYGGASHIASIVLWIIIILVGTFGTVTNTLIIIILSGRVRKRRQFHFLVSVLAIFDILSCISAILSGTSLIICFEGWINRRGSSAIYFIQIGNMTFFFSRSLSTHQTVIITVYSFLGLSYPLRAREWFTWKRTIMLPLIPIFLAIILNFPRAGTSFVTKNDYNETEFDIPSLRGIDYISIWRLKWWNIFYVAMFSIHDHIDFGIPLPLLLLLNFLSYRKMRKLKKSRVELHSNQANAVQPVRMFLPVVSFLLFCNVGVICAMFMVQINRNTRDFDILIKMRNKTSKEFLGLFSCLIIDFPTDGESRGQDCSYRYPDVCVECYQMGEFLSGEAITDYGGASHIASIVLWIIIILVGTFGTVTNTLIIIILSGRVRKRRQFHFLVSVLAVFDTLSCISAILSGTSLIICFEGWINRGGNSAIYFIQIANMTFFFSRSLTTHQTVIITVYSFLGLSYPLRAREWFTWKRTIMLPLLPIFLAIILNFPRAGTSFVTENYYNESEFDMPSLQGIDYISIWRLKWWNIFYVAMFSVHEHIDFTIPLPLLLLLNFLSYRKMRKLEKSRVELRSNQANAVKPVRMFLPVVSFLLFCNVGVICAMFMVQINRVMYRELYLTSLLWNALNSSPVSVGRRIFPNPFGGGGDSRIVQLTDYGK